MERISEQSKGLEAKWLRSRELLEIGNRAGDGFADWEEIGGLERDILLGPIKTIDDARAKLKAIYLSFDDGLRSDGADAAALGQIIRWLGANSRSGEIIGAEAA